MAFGAKGARSLRGRCEGCEGCEGCDSTDAVGASGCDRTDAVKCEGCKHTDAVGAIGRRPSAQAPRPDRTLYILLHGEATVSRAAASQAVGVVRAGECLGEMSLLTGQPHSASARAARQTKAATLTHDELTALVRFRPDVGLIILRNLAIGLGAKLGRAPAGGLGASTGD